MIIIIIFPVLCLVLRSRNASEKGRTTRVWAKTSGPLPPPPLPLLLLQLLLKPPAYATTCLASAGVGLCSAPSSGAVWKRKEGPQAYLIGSLAMFHHQNVVFGDFHDFGFVEPAKDDKVAIEALAEQVLNGEVQRCGGCRLVLWKHEKNFSCTFTKRRRGRGKYVCAHRFCTGCIKGPFRVMYAYDELGTTSSDYDFIPPKEWQCPS